MIWGWLKSFPEVLAQWPLKARCILVFLTGALCVPAMPPWCFWPVLAIGFPLFFAVLSSTRNLKTAFAESWLFAFGYFGFGLVWIGNALLVDGNPFSWVWPLAIAGLPALLALFYGISGLILKRMLRIGSLSGWLAFVGMIGLTEWMRGHILTGYPWNMYGYTWDDSLAMAQSASLIGSYGLTLLTVFWAMIPALWWFPFAQRRTATVITGLAGLLAVSFVLWGHARLAAHPLDLRSDLMVRIVQPNIPQEDKWNPVKTSENVRKLLDLSMPDDGSGSAPTIIIWPETAINERVLMHEKVAPVVQSIMQRYKGAAYLMTGLLRSEGETEESRVYFNSLGTYDDHLERIAVYDKSHLVPFGEYIPLEKYLPLKPFVELGGFQEGQGIETQQIEGVLRYSPLVCYEIIFPGAVARSEEPRPELLVNVTNDAWYGDSAGPRQHLSMTRFRSIEEGLPSARSANTGISALFDSYGREVVRASLDEPAALNAALPQSAARTIYSHIGDLLFFVSVIFIFCGVVIFRQPADKPKPAST